MVKAFSHNRSLHEIIRVQTGAPGAEDDVYLQYRETLALLAHNYHTKKAHNVIIQDEAQTTGILLQIKGLRRIDGGAPLFEVQFMCNGRFQLPIVAVSHRR